MLTDKKLFYVFERYRGQNPRDIFQRLWKDFWMNVRGFGMIVELFRNQWVSVRLCYQLFIRYW